MTKSINIKKLVRDKIPELARKNGEIPKIRILNKKEYEKELYKKLSEEVKEFIEGPSEEELADVLEIVHAISNHLNISIKQLEKTRKNKAKERGGFEKKIFLESVEKD